MSDVITQLMSSFGVLNKRRQPDMGSNFILQAWRDLVEAARPGSELRRLRREVHPAPARARLPAEARRDLPREAGDRSEEREMIVSWETALKSPGFDLTKFHFRCCPVIWEPCFDIFWIPFNGLCWPFFARIELFPQFRGKRFKSKKRVQNSIQNLQIFCDTGTHGFMVKLSYC